MLKINNLSYKYSKKAPNTLDNISFTAKNNEITILLAPNGTGKTTLIKCLCGIFKPQTGSISFNDIDLINMNQKEKSKIVSYVAQENSIPYLTAYEVIMFGRTPYIRFKESKLDYEIVDKVIEKLHIENLVMRNYNTLSGGEKQIIMIARALAQDAKIIVFDEPTSNLDIKNAIMVMDIIKSLSKANDLHVIISMHDINLALKYGDNFILLKDSKVYKEETINEINKESLSSIYDIDIDIHEEKNTKIISYK